MLVSQDHLKFSFKLFFYPVTIARSCTIENVANTFILCVAFKIETKKYVCGKNNHLVLLFILLTNNTASVYKTKERELTFYL